MTQKDALIKATCLHRRLRDARGDVERGNRALRAVMRVLGEHAARLSTVTSSLEAGLQDACLPRGSAKKLTNNVLLLEAGGRDWHPYVHMPVGFAKMTGSGHDLGLQDGEPQTVRRKPPHPLCTGSRSGRRQFHQR
jgi:hypothetical protein